MARTFISRAYASRNRPKMPIPIVRGDEWHGRPAPPWLIAGVLAMNALACLYGQSDVGKSYVAVYLALSIANGLRCLGGRAVHHGPVLYIVGEGEAWFQYRLDGWVKRHRKILRPLLRFFWVPQPINLDDDAEVGNLIESIEMTFPHEKPVLIVIDTLATSMGQGNENDTHDMKITVDALKRLRRTFGCTVLVIHHSGRDLSKGSRGSTVLRAAVDTELFLKRPKAKEPFLALVCKKLKDGAAKFDDIRLELVESIDLGVTDTSGTPITSAMVRYPGPPKPSLAQQFAVEHRRETLALLVKLGTATYGQLVKTKENPRGIPHDSLAKALHFLTADGYAEKPGKLYIPTLLG